MSFVAKHIIDSHERLIGVARLHWIYLVMGLFWAVLSFSVGLFFQHLIALYGGNASLDHTVALMGHDLGARSVWISGAFGLVAIGLFFVFFIEYLATEVALTSERVIRKTGLIAVEVQEIELAEIEAAKVKHGWFGTLLGYGAIYLDCRFVGDVYLPSIRRPYRFLAALHKMREQVRSVPSVKN